MATLALLDNFSQWIRSPEASALAAGLLQGSAPSMTQPNSFGSAFGLGLQNMNRAIEEGDKRKLARDIFGLDTQRFGLEKQTLALKQMEALRKYQEDQALNAALGINSPQAPMDGFFGNSSSPQLLPNDLGLTIKNDIPVYAVRDPRINGGRLSHIPMQDDSGKTITKEESIRLMSENPMAAQSTLAVGQEELPSAPQINQRGGLLSNLSPEKAEWARAAKLLGGKEGLLKALEPEKKTEKEKIAERLFPGDKEKQNEYLLNPHQGSATKSFLTQNQSVIQAIDNVLPKISELIEQDIPYQNPLYLGGLPTARFFSPQRMADYEAKVASITDTLVGALNLPKTNESLHLVSKMISKQPNEGDDAYRSRLNSLIQDLEVRRANAEAIAPRVGKSAAPKIKSKLQENPLGR